MERLLLASLLCASMLSGFASAYTPQEQERMTRESYREKLGQWPSIVFLCLVPDIQGTPAESAKRICDRAKTEARLIAAQSNVSLRTVDAIPEAYGISVVDGSLVLQMDVAQTQDGGAPSAAAISMRAWAFASSVTFKERDPKDRLTVVREHLRTGELTLWDHPAAIGGSMDAPASLVDQMSDVSEQMLKRFFATYIEAQQPAAP